MNESPKMYMLEFLDDAARVPPTKQDSYPCPPWAWVPPALYEDDPQITC